MRQRFEDSINLGGSLEIDQDTSSEKLPIIKNHPPEWNPAGLQSNLLRLGCSGMHSIVIDQGCGGDSDAHFTFAQQARGSSSRICSPGAISRPSWPDCSNSNPVSSFTISTPTLGRLAAHTVTLRSTSRIVCRMELNACVNWWRFVIAWPLATVDAYSIASNVSDNATTFRKVRL